MAGLIANYGLFWKRQKVWWGKQGVRGHLNGILSTNTTGIDVDFRDQQGLYTLYDDNFKMVYAGQAGANDQQRLFDRLKQHTRDALADRWTKFSWFGIRPVTKKGVLRVEKTAAHPEIGMVLDHIEAILLAASEPPHNRQGGRFGENVQQYLQSDDPRAEDEGEMIRAIRVAVENLAKTTGSS
jgi:hypothetical protein